MLRTVLLLCKIGQNVKKNQRKTRDKKKMRTVPAEAASVVINANDSLRGRRITVRVLILKSVRQHVSRVLCARERLVTPVVFYFSFFFFWQRKNPDASRPRDRTRSKPSATLCKLANCTPRTLSSRRVVLQKNDDDGVPLFIRPACNDSSVVERSAAGRRDGVFFFFFSVFRSVSDRRK